MECTSKARTVFPLREATQAHAAHWWHLEVNANRISKGTFTLNGKPAAGIKVTGPDMKDFKLYFDKESGLPVKQEARVAGFMGGEFTQVTTYAEYKEMGGIKKATKVKATRDGEKFMEQQVVEFKVLDKVDAKVFTEGA